MSIERMEEEITITEQDQHLTFELSGEGMSVPVTNVLEIISYGKLTRMPMVPEFIEGVINLRGNVVPVINLSAKFGLEKTEFGKRTCIVIMEVMMGDEMVTIGVVVEKVLQVIEIPEDKIDPRPSLGANIKTSFIKGMARTDNGFIVILEIDQVLSAAEISIVNDMNIERGIEGVA